MVLGIIIILIICTAPYFYRVHKRLQRLEQQIEELKKQHSVT